MTIISQQKAWELPFEVIILTTPLSPHGFVYFHHSLLLQLKSFISIIKHKCSSLYGFMEAFYFDVDWKYKALKPLQVVKKNKCSSEWFDHQSTCFSSIQWGYVSPGFVWGFSKIAQKVTKLLVTFSGIDHKVTLYYYCPYIYITMTEVCPVQVFCFWFLNG